MKKREMRKVDQKFYEVGRKTCRHAYARMGEGNGYKQKELIQKIS